MDLPLDIIRTRGRAAVPIAASVVGELREEDVALLAEERGIKPALIKRLSERHHSLARCLASGKSPGEAAALTGYDISRVSILTGDPSFKELVNFYREDVQRQYVGLHEVMAGLSLDAFLELRQRVEDEPEKLKTGELLEIAKVGADRTGHGPSSTQQVNVNIGLADRLEAARKRVAERTLELRANKEP